MEVTLSEFMHNTHQASHVFALDSIARSAYCPRRENNMELARNSLAGRRHDGSDGRSFDPRAARMALTRGVSYFDTPSRAEGAAR
jgi:hypothetical protein